MTTVVQVRNERELTLRSRQWGMERKGKFWTPWKKESI